MVKCPLGCPINVESAFRFTLDISCRRRVNKIIKKPFLPYIEWFRGLSILLIFFSHLRSSILNDWYYYILQNATVFFLFISGFLFQYLFHPQETTWAFWGKKLQKLVLPYLAAAGLGYAIHFFTGGSVPSLGDLGYQLLSGAIPFNVGYWYIPAILSIFLLHPLLKYLALHRRLLTLLTGVFLAVSMVTFRSAGNANPFLNAGHFFGVFLLGMSSAAWWGPLEILLRQWRVLIIPAGFLLFVPLLFMIPQSAWKDMEGVIAQGAWGINWSLLSRLVVIPSLLSLLILFHDKGWKFKYFSITGKMSFGIFFYHGYLIHIVNSDWVNSFLPQNSLWVFFVNVIFVLGGLWVGLTLIHKYMGKNSAYLTGY